MKVNMASYVEDLVKCGFLEMKLPRKQRKLTHKASCDFRLLFIPFDNYLFLVKSFEYF